MTTLTELDRLIIWDAIVMMYSLGLIGYGEAKRMADILTERRLNTLLRENKVVTWT